MAERLYIRLEAAGGDECQTVVLSEDGRIVRPVERTTLTAAAPLAARRRVVLLLPGVDVVTTQVALPALGRARLRQMLPYSLEETFAEDVEHLLFAPGPRLASGEVRVSVAVRARLEEWLARAADAGIDPDAVYSEADGVPDTPSTVSLILEAGRVYGRRPGQAPFVLEGLDLEQLYDLLAAQSQDESDLQHLDVYMEADEQADYRAGLDRLEPRAASLNRRILADGVLARLAATLSVEEGTNLRQGSYARKSNVAGLLRPWRAAAVLLLALGAAHLAARGVEYFDLRREDAALTEMVGTRCQQAFASTRLSACAEAVRQRLGAAGLPSAGGETFLTTLATIAEHLEEDSRIEALSYRNRVMDLQVVVPDSPSLDELAQRIGGTIQTTNPGEEGVEARLQVAEGGS